MLAGSEGIKALYATAPILAASEFPNGVKFMADYQSAYKIASVYGGY